MFHVVNVLQALRERKVEGPPRFSPSPKEAFATNKPSREELQRLREEQTAAGRRVSPTAKAQGLTTGWDLPVVPKPVPKETVSTKMNRISTKKLPLVTTPAAPVTTAGGRVVTATPKARLAAHDPQVASTTAHSHEMPPLAPKPPQGKKPSERKYARVQDGPRPLIEKPRAQDVLFGRGACIASHVGNGFYRRLVWEKKSEYLATKDLQHKKRIAQDVINHIHGLEPPGRFLQLASATSSYYSGPWVEATRERVVEKTCQGT